MLSVLSKADILHGPTQSVLASEDL